MATTTYRGGERRRTAARLRENALGIVAHDLKTPLSTIIMAAELLGEVQDESRRQHFLDVIVQAARQADFLIHDLLDVTRIENSALLVEPSSEPASYLIASVAELFEDAATTAGIALSCDTSALGHEHVMVENPRFVQLLSNLISNALKFTGSGGRVVVSGRPVGGDIEIRVADNGLGIDADELPHVFERFWQATHHRRAGAGLGLAIAKGIVEAHGGRIWVESKAGVGSTFYFTIPRAPDPCAADRGNPMNDSRKELAASN